MFRYSFGLALFSDIGVATPVAFLGRALSSRPVSPDVGRELLTNFSVPHYSAWETRVQIINFRCLLSLSDQGPCEHVEAAFAGLACAGNLASWPAWQVFGNRSPGCEVTSKTSVGTALPTGSVPGRFSGEGHLSSGEGPGHGPQGRTKCYCSTQHPHPARPCLPSPPSHLWWPRVPGCRGDSSSTVGHGDLSRWDRFLPTTTVPVTCPEHVGRGT